MCFFCIPGKTSFNATQGMECGAHASGFVRGHSWPSSTFRAVASLEGKGQEEDVSVQSVPRGRWQQGVQSQGGRWKRGPNATSQSSSKVRSLEALWPRWARGVVSQDRNLVRVEKSQRTGDGTGCFRSRGQNGSWARQSGEVGTSDCSHGGFEGPNNGRVGDSVETGATRSTGDAFGIRPGKLPSRGHGRGLSTSTKNEPQKFSESRSANVNWKNFGLPRMCSRWSHQFHPSMLPEKWHVFNRWCRNLQRQLQHQGGLVVAPAIVPGRIRKREDYVPSTHQEFLKWMADRQEDMNAALMAGNPAEAARGSGVITDATRSLQSVTMQPSMITNMVN